MAKKRQYVYSDIFMLAGIVSDEPKVNMSHNGKSYANFSIGERFGHKGAYRYKNYRCAAYGETGNEILSKVKKNDNILVIGHVEAYPFKSKDGRNCAGLWINVVKWEQAPTKRDWEMKEKELEQDPERVEEEEETEDINAETLWGIDF